MRRCSQRRPALLAVLAVLVAGLALAGADEFKCGKFMASGREYDFSALDNKSALEKTITYTGTEKTTVKDVLTFNPCAPLKQCGPRAAGDALACYTKSADKEGVTVAIDVVAAGKTKRVPTSSESAVTVRFEGGDGDLEVDFACDKSASETPEITEFAFKDKKVAVKVKSKTFCTTTADSPKDENKGGSSNDKDKDNGNKDGGGEQKGMSGAGIFFLTVFVLFVAYMVIGCVYNYVVFRATGWELLPHSEFWQRVLGGCFDGAIVVYERIRGARGGQYYAPMI